MCYDNEFAFADVSVRITRTEMGLMAEVSRDSAFAVADTVMYVSKSPNVYALAELLVADLAIDGDVDMLDVLASLI